MHDKPNPNEEETAQTPYPPIVGWGTSTVSFDVDTTENNDKLNTLAEAGY